jgi:hypothetical protein
METEDSFGVTMHLKHLNPLTDVELERHVTVNQRSVPEAFQSEVARCTQSTRSARFNA